MRNSSSQSKQRSKSKHRKAVQRASTKLERLKARFAGARAIERASIKLDKVRAADEKRNG